MSKLLLFLIGQVVFVGVLRLVWKSNATRWNRLARAYAADAPLACKARRHLQSVILVGGGIAFNSYRGIVRVGATNEGMTLSLLPPWSFFHPPLLIPYGDIRIQPTSWYLNTKSFKCSFADASDVEVLVDEELMEWVEAQAARLPRDAGACAG